jgi:hypothetical protein
MEYLGDAWAGYRDFVSTYDDTRLPLPAWLPVGGEGSWFPIAANDYVNAVMAGVFVRAVMHRRVHWARLLATVWLLASGGTTFAAFVLGNRPRWLTSVPIANAILVS